MKDNARKKCKFGLIVVMIALVALTPVSAGGGISAGPWRDINPTQFSTAGDSSVPGPDVAFNGIFVRTAGFGSVGAGEAWAVGGCGPTTTSPTFPFSGGNSVTKTGCYATGSTPPGGGTISYYDGFSWKIIGDPYNGLGSFYTGVNFCTSPGSPGVGLCSPNGDGSDGWIVGGAPTATTKGPVALYVTGPGAVSEDSAGLNPGLTTGGYLTAVFEVCHVDNDPNGKGCPSGTAGDAYAVGTDGTHGVIYQYSGGAPSVGSWSLVFTSTLATIYNGVYMYIDSTGNLEGFAVGDKGAIAHFYGTWTENTVALRQPPSTESP